MNGIKDTREETFATEDKKATNAVEGDGDIVNDSFAAFLTPHVEEMAVEEASEPMREEATENVETRKKSAIVSTLSALAIGLTIGLVIGILIGRFTARSEAPATVQEESEQLLASEEVKFDRQPDVSKLIVDWDYRRPERVCFTFDEPIAPDYFVGYGSIGSGYAIFEQNPERWDPLGIGTSTALGLMKTLRMEISGLTEDIYAEGHEMTVTIAKTHFDQREEIIEKVKVVAQDYFDGLAKAAETGVEADNGIDEVS